MKTIAQYEAKVEVLTNDLKVKADKIKVYEECIAKLKKDFNMCNDALNIEQNVTHELNGKNKVLAQRCILWRKKYLDAVEVNVNLKANTNLGIMT